MNESGNICAFSPDRVYRYTLLHSWADMLSPELKTIAWIALNPSTADENQLDPTLRRIRGFSAAWGYNSFMMLNAFAFRATDPKEMERAADPNGPENDAYLLAETAKVDKVTRRPKRPTEPDPHPSQGPTALLPQAHQGRISLTPALPQERPGARPLELAATKVENVTCATSAYLAVEARSGGCR